MGQGPLFDEVGAVHDLRIKICDFVINDRWDVDRLEMLLGVQTASAVVAHVGSLRNSKDVLIWLPDKNWMFSTKSEWDFLRLKMPRFDWAMWIWNKLLPKKISICMWKASFNYLSVDDQVRKLGIPFSL